MSDSKLKAWEVKQAKLSWSKGRSCRTLGDRYNVSHTDILYHVRDVVRVTAPRMGRPRSFDHAKARAMVAKGRSYRAVASRFGVSPARICQVMKEAA